MWYDCGPLDVEVNILVSRAALGSHVNLSLLLVSCLKINQGTELQCLLKVKEDLS